MKVKMKHRELDNINEKLHKLLTEKKNTKNLFLICKSTGRLKVNAMLMEGFVHDVGRSGDRLQREE